MNDKELVSIHCITYNHSKYIRACLDSIVMQKTNFKFTAYVGDDCSTDGTQEIIKEYEKKYPDIIKGIYQSKNTKIVGNLFDVLAQCKGKYLIFCEGDDYWTDENKLQKQVDFMEQNPEYSICFHSVEKIIENTSTTETFPTDKMIKNGFSFENLLKYNFIQTNSALHRYDCVRNLIDIFPKVMIPGDWYIHLLFAKQGKIKYFDEVMSVYKIHQAGVWGNLDYRDRMQKYFLRYLNFYINVYRNIAENKKEYIRELIYRYRQLFGVLLDRKDYKKLMLLTIYHPIIFLKMTISLFKIIYVIWQ